MKYRKLYEFKGVGDEGRFDKIELADALEEQ